MQRFKNKVVLVTGAASGIGRASAERFASEGATLLCADLNEAALTTLVNQISDSGAQVSAYVFDISSEDEVDSCVNTCIDRYGKLDVVVNMAGILRFDNAHELDFSAWQKVIDINLSGTFLLCKAALPHLISSKGNIVNAASTSAIAGLPCGIAYSASKGGVLAMTRTIAVEYAKRGVRANCVCPGDIETNMTNAVVLPNDYDYDEIIRICSRTGTKGPEAVAGVIAMLASEDGAHINGEDIRVDGGTLS